jgi:ligand-binding sensor domain-containing protein
MHKNIKFPVHLKFKNLNLIDNFFSMLINANYRKSGKIGVFITTAILILIALPQTMAHGLKYHEFLPIDHRSGMDASVVNCIVQDNHGLIWLGTDRGLYSYDGYTAKKYSAKTQSGIGNDGVVYCAEIVDTSRIWLGTDNGLVIFNTYTDKFETAPEGLPDNIRAISQIDSHTYWIGSLNGLYRYDLSAGKPKKINDALLPHQAIYTILRYDDNTFYFGTYNGLSKYDSRTKSFNNISNYIPIS